MPKAHPAPASLASLASLKPHKRTTKPSELLQDWDETVSNAGSVQGFLQRFKQSEARGQGAGAAAGGAGGAASVVGGREPSREPNEGHTPGASGVGGRAREVMGRQDGGEFSGRGGRAAGGVGTVGPLYASVESQHELLTHQQRAEQLQGLRSMMRRRLEQADS